jgi:hypothetical protein
MSVLDPNNRWNIEASLDWGMDAARQNDVFRLTAELLTELDAVATLTEAPKHDWAAEQLSR